MANRKNTTKPTAKHTPGPWRAELTGSSPVKIIADNDIVGYAVYGPLQDVDTEHQGGVPTAEANARLIAAAPDLLAALKAATHALETATADGKPLFNCVAASRARELIYKTEN